RGYRFVATVTAEIPTEATAPPPMTQPVRSRWMWFLAVVALAVGVLVTMTLILRPKPKQALPENPKAAEYYLEAEKKADDLNSIETVIDLYTNVTKLAPGFAPGWAGLANIEVVQVFGSPGNPEKYRKDSEEHARKALELDPHSALAHAVLGNSFW